MRSPYRHCEEVLVHDEAISLQYLGLLWAKVHRPRNNEEKYL